MKSERISIFNYEAFYLDHLEGNLGEEDTALLMAFLEEHPDLIEEEDDFVMLDPMMDSPVFDDKESLKIVSDDAAIVLANVEHFLIAESEGQLPAAKQEELNAFVVQHPHLKKERKYLAAMFLKADESIVYAEKSGLKRKGAVIFWPYIALAAASVLIAFLFVMNNGSEDQQLAENDVVENKNEEKQESPIIENDDLQYAEDIVPSNSSDSYEGQEQGQENPSPSPRAIVNPPKTPGRSNLATVNEIKHRQARRVINSIESKKLQPVSPKIDAPTMNIIPENDYAQAAASESERMKNPIKPITSRLEKTLKTDVDFKTGKAANNTGAGFFLKIGKFELSRNNARKKKTKK